MFGSLGVSASGLIAQRTRLEIVSANLANSSSVQDAKGNYNPYRRKFPVFSVGDPTTGNRNGVHIAEILEDKAPFIKKFEPGHPFANKEGYVNYPNVDTATEMVNAMEATRAYEANITAVEATKSMLQSSLRLIA